MTIKALIPARSGSVRVKNKNIAPFAGSSLLEIKIKQMLRIPELDGVVVNSNSDEMLEIARRLGAETVKRDDYYASSSVSINEVCVNIAQNFDADIIVYTNATNPLVKDESISTAIAKYYEIADKHDSLNSAHAVKEFMWLNNNPVNYDPDNMPRSQDLPDILALNFAFNILPRDVMLKNRRIVGNKPYLFEIDKQEAVDIDDKIDFDFAEFLYKKEYLHEC